MILNGLIRPVLRRGKKSRKPEQNAGFSSGFAHFSEAPYAERKQSANRNGENLVISLLNLL